MHWSNCQKANDDLCEEEQLEEVQQSLDSVESSAGVFVILNQHLFDGSDEFLDEHGRVQ